MSAYPVLMSAPMVRAILAGRKSQTRRLLKGQWAKVKPGDLLWVREAFRLRADQNKKPPSQDWWKSGAWYEADGLIAQPSGCAGGSGKLRPSIHMPRWASRLTLRVTEVRRQRLQEISEADAGAEGLCAEDEFCNPDKWRNMPDAGHYLLQGFRKLWDALNASRAPWASNPEVAAVSFEVIRGNVEGVGK